MSSRMLEKAGKVQLLKSVEAETKVEKRSGSFFSVLISAVTVRKDAEYFSIPLGVDAVRYETRARFKPHSKCAIFRCLRSIQEFRSAHC